MPETKASREIKELTLLFEISTKLSETLDLKTVLQPILQMTTEYMGILRSTLTILNRKKGEIVIEEAYGLRPEEQAKGKYRRGEGITGKVFETGQPAIIPRISEEPLFLDRTGSRRKTRQKRHRLYLRTHKDRKRGDRDPFGGPLVHKKRRPWKRMPVF